MHGRLCVLPAAFINQWNDGPMCGFFQCMTHTICVEDRTIVWSLFWIYTSVYVFSSLSCSDVDECQTGRTTCANDTVCFNLDGGYDCRCPHGHNCSGDCIHDSKVKHSGQIWMLENDRCSVCSCQVSVGPTVDYTAVTLVIVHLIWV